MIIGDFPNKHKLIYKIISYIYFLWCCFLFIHK